jgi:hypothetical protein
MPDPENGFLCSYCTSCFFTLLLYLNRRGFSYLTTDLNLSPFKIIVINLRGREPIPPHMSLQPGILILLSKNTDVSLHANSCEPKFNTRRQRGLND